MGREDVKYFCDGEGVRGWLYRPAVDMAVPGVVFCPGYTGTRQAAFYQPYVESLVDHGYAVLLSDYRGWGDSEGLPYRVDPRRQTDDIRAGVTFLRTRGGIDPGRIGILGVSFGGGHATYVNAVDRRVRAAAAISAVGDGEEFLRRMRREYEWYEFLDELERERQRAVLGEPARLVDPNEDIQISTPERRATTVKGPQRSATSPTRTPLLDAQAILEYAPRRFAALTRRMLWICVEDDAVVPAAHSRAMFQAASEPKRLVVLPGRGHYDAYVSQFDVINHEILAWFNFHLKSIVPAVRER